MSDSTERDLPRHRWREAVKRRIVALHGSAFVAGTRQRDYLVSLGMAADCVRLGFDVVDNEHFAHGADLARRNAVAERARLGLPERYFLAVCRFVPEKNLLRLIEGYGQYRRRARGDGDGAWRLVIVGDGPLRQEASQLIGARGLADDVSLVGFRQYAELPAYYGLAGAFVHASTMEPWGLVVNEAMAAGLPVIVSERCGCVEDLVTGRNGYRFDPSDAEGLGRLLHHVASAGCEREALAREGRAVIAAWTPDRFASGLREAALLALHRPASGTSLDQCLVRALIERREAAEPAMA